MPHLLLLPADLGECAGVKHLLRQLHLVDARGVADDVLRFRVTAPGQQPARGLRDQPVVLPVATVFAYLLDEGHRLGSTFISW